MLIRSHLKATQMGVGYVVGGYWRMMAGCWEVNHGFHPWLFILNHFVVLGGALFCFPQIASVAIQIEPLRGS